jgi:pyridoxine 5-phosphate synthase
VLAQLRSFGCRTSVFIDADPDAVARAHTLGADRVELYTEPYAAAFARGDGDAALTRFVRAAQEAKRVGIGVNAGHDLNQQNLGAFLANVPDVLEVSIGHALVADALEFGLARTVERYLAIVAAGQRA